MPFDGDENFYDKGHGEPSLASVVNRFGLKTYTNTFLAKHMNTEQNVHDAGFFYYNRWSMESGLLFFVIALVWTGISHSNDIILLIILTIFAFVATAICFVYEPFPPACWSERIMIFVDGTVIPFEGINSYNNIKKILPRSTAKIGRLTKDGNGNFGSYLIVRHEDEEAVIGIWTENANRLEPISVSV